MNDKEKIEAIKKIFDQSRMKRMSLAEEFGEEELTEMNYAIEKIVYSQRIRKMTQTDNEKIENIKELLNGYGSTFSPSHLISIIKGILEK